MEHPPRQNVRWAKTNPNKFKMIRIIQNMFSDYNGIKLEISSNKIFKKTSRFGNWTTYFKVTHRSKKKSQKKLENI